MSGTFNVGGIPSLFKKITFEGSTGTARINLPDGATTSADGIAFGSDVNLYRNSANKLRVDGSFVMGDAFYMAGGSLVFNKFGGGLILNDNNNWTSVKFKGLYTIESSSLTGSSATSALSITQTWNTTGSPTLIFANVTNTASGASANLMDLQVGGVSRANINTAGTLTLVGNLISQRVLSNSDVSVATLSTINWNNRSALSSGANGNIMISNSAKNDFNLLFFMIYSWNFRLA